MERMRVRTDLALEAKESFSGSDVEVHGVVVEEEYDKEQNLRLTRVRDRVRAGSAGNGKTHRYLSDIRSSWYGFP